jgi:hypothetical protein
MLSPNSLIFPLEAAKQKNRSLVRKLGKQRPVEGKAEPQDRSVRQGPPHAGKGPQGQDSKQGNCHVR